MVDSKENYKFDQGVKGLNLAHAAIFLSWWKLYLISSIVFFFQPTEDTNNIEILPSAGMVCNNF